MTRLALVFTAALATLYATFAYFAGTDTGFTPAALTAIICLAAIIARDYIGRTRDDES